MDNHEDLLTGLTSGQMNCKRGYVRELVPCHELINHFSSFFFFFTMLPKRNWFSSALKNPGESQWQVEVGIAGNRTYIYSVLISIKCARSSVESYTLRPVFLFIFVLFFFYFVTRKFYASQGRDRVAILRWKMYFNFRGILLLF